MSDEAEKAADRAAARARSARAGAQRGLRSQPLPELLWPGHPPAESRRRARGRVSRRLWLVGTRAADPAVTAHPPKPLVPEVRALAVAYYAKPGNGAGGNLHIVLDDYNVDNDAVDFCLARAREAGDEDGVRIAEALRRMSRSARLRVARGAG